MVPRWSPDGQRIAFYANRTGNFEIWTIRPDGSGLRQLTETPGQTIMYYAWSPDGSRMAYYKGYDRLFYFNRKVDESDIWLLTLNEEQK